MKLFTLYTVASAAIAVAAAPSSAPAEGQTPEPINAEPVNAVVQPQSQSSRTAQLNRYDLLSSGLSLASMFDPTGITKVLAPLAGVFMKVATPVAKSFLTQVLPAGAKALSTAVGGSSSGSSGARSAGAGAGAGAGLGGLLSMLGKRSLDQAATQLAQVTPPEDLRMLFNEVTKLGQHQLQALDTLATQFGEGLANLGEAIAQPATEGATTLINILDETAIMGIHVSTEISKHFTGVLQSLLQKVVLTPLVKGINHGLQTINAHGSNQLNGETGKLAQNLDQFVKNAQGMNITCSDLGHSVQQLKSSRNPQSQKA